MNETPWRVAFKVAIETRGHRGVVDALYWSVAADWPRIPAADEHVEIGREQHYRVSFVRWRPELRVVVIDLGVKTHDEEHLTRLFEQMRADGWKVGEDNDQ